jgi:hypothetical protein
VVCELLRDELVPPGQLHVTQPKQNPVQHQEINFHVMNSSLLDSFMSYSTSGIQQNKNSR